jgi:hypothetical protein
MSNPMSTATAHAIDAGTPAARALREADGGIGTWLGDLVAGAGSSPSHIIVTGVLGVIPGVGQAMDARDLVLGMIQLAKSPKAAGAWIEIVITLIGCVPAIGDALKVGFKLMQQGHNFGRVLEAVSPKLHGNVEKFMRTIDWRMLAAESKGLFSKVLAAFIDGIDSWMIKALAGKAQVKQVIDELKGLQKIGPRMIDEAFGDLKKMHAKMMGHELPGTTAALAGTTSRVVKEEGQEAAKAAVIKEARAAAAAEKKLLFKKNRDATTNRATPNTTKNDTKKKAEPKKKKWNTGVPAEHITDYHVKKKHANFSKANNGGKLTEESSIPHVGLDHLWSNKTHATKPFVVGETKSSIFDSFRLMAALPAQLREKFNALRADEAANPTANNGKPNIFQSEGRDEHANQRVPIGDTAAHDLAVRQGVNKPNDDTGLRAQMSHKWIEKALIKEQLTVIGQELKGLIRKYLRDEIPCPYQRWISLVTGRQLHKHQQSGGSTHDIQLMLDLPENILDR